MANDHDRQESLFRRAARGANFRAEVLENPTPANYARWIKAGPRSIPESPPSGAQLGDAAQARERARRTTLSADFHAGMVRRFRFAATRPWLPVPPDDPGPRYEIESKILLKIPNP